MQSKLLFLSFVYLSKNIGTHMGLHDVSSNITEKSLNYYKLESYGN